VHVVSQPEEIDMSKREAREQRVNGWLDHLRRCEAAGGSVASDAKQHGIAGSCINGAVD
jgi:hypothetical protein